MEDRLTPDQAASAGPASERPPADLTKLKGMFEEWRDATERARTLGMTAIDYYHSEQWTAAEKRVLKKRKQPVVTYNHVKRAINGTIGVVERGKSEPRAYPRTPKDEGSADVATDVLRFIAEQNRLNAIKASGNGVFWDMLVPGTGAAIVEVDGNLQVTIAQIKWEEFCHDPRSRKLDFTDARFKGVAKWMFADDVAAMYPDSRSDINQTVSDGSLSVVDASFDDRPNNLSWIDRRNRRMMVVDLYYREGDTWMRGVFHAGGLLKDGVSEYLDAKGRPSCPIEAISAYIDKDNQRYGAVRDMIGPQDEVNQRRSRLLHHANSRQLQETIPGAGQTDPDIARSEAARPDGIIPTGLQIAGTNDMVSGQRELLQDAKAEMDLLGPNPAILGRQGADSSGRALLARSQAGLVELAILFGGLEDWELRVYRQCWARAKQFWKAETYIRVTDDEGAPEFVGLNVPKGQPVIDPNTGQPAMDPQTGQPVEGPPVIDPNTGGSVFGYKNVVAEMDVDIILDATPDTANIQQEQFQDLMQLVGANPAYAQQIPFEVMLEMSAVPHKRQLIDKLKKFREEAQAQQAQQAQMQMQMAEQARQIAEAKAGADINRSNSQADLNRARAETEMLDGHLAIAAQQQSFMPAAGVMPGAPPMGPQGLPMPPQGPPGPPMPQPYPDIQEPPPGF